MATPVTDLIPMMQREVNAPGAEQFLDASPGDLIGYIEDGFWDARLAGLLRTFTVVNGSELDPPIAGSGRFITDMKTKTADLGRDWWMLIVVFAGFRLLRSRIMNLAVNFKAVAGPVEYEQQASATVLRALLDSLQRRVDELKALYSEELSSGGFAYFDGVLQREYSELSNALMLTVR